MVYTKPAVTLVGEATDAVQGGKDDDQLDSPHSATVGAYEADE